MSGQALGALGELNELGAEIAVMISQDGPISVERYMQICLQHPRYGYYIRRDPFGAPGDFTTAPEISQMFGELLGLWAAQTWEDMWAQQGGARPARLLELGPGRGTMMADAVRAARAARAFYENLEIGLVETSPVLRQVQRQALAGFLGAKKWFGRIEDAGAGPAILLANEFFDALPIRQYQRQDGVWRERLVGLDARGGLTFGVAREDQTQIAIAGETGSVQDGAIFEVGAAAQRQMIAIAARIMRAGGAALIIDYGYARTQIGETLQAMRAHKFVDPLERPGDCDLTAHVDFAALARAARNVGARVYGPISQALFLRRLGIDARARALCAADPSQCETIESARARLTAQDESTQMGALFKVLCVTRPEAPIPPGFEPSGPETNLEEKAFA